jgi:hypothetical protein
MHEDDEEGPSPGLVWGFRLVIVLYLFIAAVVVAWRLGLITPTP